MKNDKQINNQVNQTSEDFSFLSGIRFKGSTVTWKFRNEISEQYVLFCFPIS